jgi:hypothetical protein
MTTDVQIERAFDADGPSILQLLRNAGLPIDGLIEHLNAALVARDGVAIVGCSALESMRTARSCDRWSLHRRHGAAAWGED